MFAKIFSQIFDSSIARDYVVRHVFMDFLVLADRDGVVDMTIDAISRRTNVPEPLIVHALGELTRPDESSRSKEEKGCRLAPLDSHRDWGWQIVNYEHYRNLVDEESRRAYFRDKKREQRQKFSKKAKTVKDVRDSPTLSNNVTQAEAFPLIPIQDKGEAFSAVRDSPKNVQDMFSVTRNGVTVTRDDEEKECTYSPDDDPEENIPDGMPILQYAGFVLERAHVPAGYMLKVRAGDALGMLAKEEACSLALATKRMLDRMRAAQKQGPVKWNFWFQDGDWKQRVEAEISTEGWERETD